MSERNFTVYTQLLIYKNNKLIAKQKNFIIEFETFFCYYYYIILVLFFSIY